MPRESLKPYLSKAAKYCATQERAPSQVSAKLLQWGVAEDETEDILSELRKLDFLNEKRFCRAYCRDKFRFNKWGKVKIRQQLRMLGFSDDRIDEGLNEIPKESYEQMIRALIEARKSQRQVDSPIEKQKLTRYLLQKGFEYESFSKFF